MNQTSSVMKQVQNEFSALGISCSEERFTSLLSIPINEYAGNLRTTVQRLDLSSDDHLLILRTANIHFVEALLTVVFEVFPTIRVDLVTQQAFLPYIKHPQVNAILIPDGPITTESLANILTKDSQKKYLLALVPYSNAYGDGYENVILAVRNSFSGKMRGVGSNGRMRMIYRYPRIAWALRRPLRAAGFALMLILLTGMALWFKGFLPAKRRLKKIYTPG
ncbi:hypothetical protein [Trichloromonas sp.]|uniref:hypothetical protein n=1 Tax=Trichloromonas sp. TaxID=3069249 RepID=UPI002A43C3FB|nr:hypothetical protein [Trichloromonas sp.]